MVQQRKSIVVPKDDLLPAHQKCSVCNGETKDIDSVDDFQLVQCALTYIYCIRIKQSINAFFFCNLQFISLDSEQQVSYAWSVHYVHVIEVCIYFVLFIKYILERRQRRACILSTHV